MAESTLLTDYMGRGLASARPTSLSVATNALALYYATDTSTWAYWNGSGWTTLLMGVNTVVAGAGLSGGTITAAGTISANWNGGTVSALSDLLAISSGTLDVATAVRSVPFAFSFSGKPLAGQMIHTALISDVPITIAAGFTGTVGYVGTNPTASATFTLSKVHSGTATAIGTIAISTAGALTLTAASAYTSAAGDTLRLTAPSVQDATLADVCLTIEAKRP